MYATRKNAVKKGLIKESEAIEVFVKTPHYHGYELQANMYPSVYTFKTSRNFEKGLVQRENAVIEYVTYPNNPTGLPMEPMYPSSPYIIHDYAYYWPHLTNVTKAMDNDIMLFTASKSLGAAGTRFGWAFVRDPEIA